MRVRRRGPRAAHRYKELARNEIITGLDIGSTKICATVGSLGDDGLKIIGAGIGPSTGVRKGAVVDMEATVNGIREAVDKAERMAGEEIRPVVLGVTGEHISTLNSKGVIAITRPDRMITRDDVDRVMEASRVVILPPDREIIHSIPRTFSIDGQDGVRDPVGFSGVRLEVETHLVHGATTFLQNATRCVEKAGLEVEDIALAAIATSEAVLVPAERELGVALVDVGGGTTDVAVYKDGEIFYSAVIPIGGEMVSHDIAMGLQASLAEAERVKIEYGAATEDSCEEEDVFEYNRMGTDEPRQLPRTILAHIIEPRMEEIFERVKQEIMKSGCAGLLPAGAVLTGGGSLLPDVVSLASRMLGLPARVGLPRNVSGMADAVESPIWATSVGLVQFTARAMAEQEEDRPRGLLGGIFGRIFRRGG